MSKIIRFREFATRRMECLVTGKDLSNYRFCDEKHFDDENMKRLSEALQNPETRSYPKRLRTLDQCEVHDRATKFIELPELESWLASGLD